MNFLKKLAAANAVVNVPTTSRSRADEDHGAVILTPTEGNIRINPTLVNYLGVNYAEVIRSTAERTAGVSINILGVSVGGVVRNLLSIVTDVEDTSGFKLATPTNKHNSAMQFSSAKVWSDFGGQANKIKTYTVELMDAVVDVEVNEAGEITGFLTLSVAQEKGLVAVETNSINGDFIQAVWTEAAGEDYEGNPKAGTKVVLGFVLEEEQSVITDAPARKKSKKAKTEKVEAVVENDDFEDDDFDTDDFDA
jgi:hypothetical protein